MSTVSLKEVNIGAGESQYSTKTMKLRSFLRQASVSRRRLSLLPLAGNPSRFRCLA